MSSEPQNTLFNKALALEQRLEALFEVSQHYEPQQFEALFNLLNDESEDLELRAAVALCFGKFGELSLSEEVRAPFFHALANLRTHPEPKLRTYVMMAFGMMGETAAIPFMIEALSDEDNTVFYAAADALVNMDRDALPYLTELIHDGHEEDIRCVAAWKLGELGFTDSIEVLIALIKDEETPPNLKALSVWALGEIGHRTRAVIETLDTALQHPDADIHERAQLALKKIARHSN